MSCPTSLKRGVNEIGLRSRTHCSRLIAHCSPLTADCPLPRSLLDALIGDGCRPTALIVTAHNSGLIDEERTLAGFAVLNRRGHSFKAVRICRDCEPVAVLVQHFLA